MALVKFTIEELQGITQRQVKVYGDLLDRISNEVRAHGLKELADKIQYYKVNYGLGHYRLDSIPLPRMVIKREATRDEAIREVLVVLNTNKGRRLSLNELMRLVVLRISQHVWQSIRKELLDKYDVKTIGRGVSTNYWLE